MESNLKINPAEEIIAFGGLSLRMLLTGDQSNGTAFCFEMTVAASKGLPAPPHSHDHYEETLYGISGVLTWVIDGVTYALGAGQALCIPRGAVHAFANHGEVEAKVLVTITPAAIGPQFFREMAAVVNAAVDGPPDRAKMMEIALRYGLTPAPPTGA